MKSLIKMLIIIVLAGIYGGWLGSIGFGFPTKEYLIGIAFVGVFTLEYPVLEAIFGEEK